MALADEILLLDEGNIKLSGSPKEVMPKLGFVAKDNPDCQLSAPTALHGAKIPTTC